MRKKIIKCEYDERGRLIKRNIINVRTNITNVYTFTYEDKEDGGYIANKYINGNLKCVDVYDKKGRLIESNNIYENGKRIYKYDKKGRLINQIIYKNGEKYEIKSIIDDENRTILTVSYYTTSITSYSKKDGSKINMIYYKNPKPCTIADMKEENITSITEYKYKYSEDKTKLTKYLKEKTKDRYEELIYEIDRYFCKAINNYLKSKIVCKKANGEISSITTYEYNDKGLLINEIKERN